MLFLLLKTILWIEWSEKKQRNQIKLNERKNSCNKKQKSHTAYMSEEEEDDEKNMKINSLCIMIL